MALVLSPRFIELLKKLLPISVVLVIIGFGLEGAWGLRADLGGDATQNFLSSYNFYSNLEYGHDIGAPGFRREPLPNWILAIFLFIFYRPESGLSKVEVLSKQPILDAAVHVNIFWAILLFALAWVLCRQLFEDSLVADLVALFSIIISNAVFVRLELNNLNTELPAAAILLLLAVVTVHSFRHNSFASYVSVGVVYGLLVLTKASGAYVAFATIPLYAFALEKRFNLNFLAQYKQILKTLLCLAIGFGIVVGPWISRNYLEFDSPAIAQGGGRVLWIRSEFNKINRSQYLGAFYAYSPTLLRQSIWEPFLGYKSSQLECGGDLQLHRRLDCDVDLLESKRFDDVKSLYMRGKKALPLKFQRNAIASGLTFDVDDEGKREFFNTFKRYPLKHFALTLPLAWRGLWSFAVSDWFGTALNFVVMTNFVFMPLIAIILRSRVLFLLSLAPSAYFWFYAFVSQFWTRFSEPFVPIAVIIFFYTINFLIVRKSMKSSRVIQS